MIWKLLVVIGLVCLVLLTCAAADGMAKQYKKDNDVVVGPGVFGPVNHSAYWQGSITIAALWAGGILLGLVLKPRKPRALQPPSA